MEIEHIYEGQPSSEIQELLETLKKKGSVEVKQENAEDWSEEERWNFYLKELLPLSVQNQKKLRGKVRTHGAGKITFTNDVLIIGDQLYIGEEEGIKGLRQDSGVSA